MRSCYNSVNNTGVDSMDRNLDILGETFGNLTVVGYSHTQRNGSYWDCVCKCGNTKKSNKKSSHDWSH